MIWYLYTLWRDSHYQMNTSIISHIYFCFWWESLNSTLLCLVTQSCPTLCDPMDYSPRHLCPWGLPQEYWSELLCPPLGDPPKPGIKPRSPTLQVNSLPAEPPGKPKNTWVGSLCLLRQIFPTQELNWGLLHCRRILYQLSHKGSSFGSGKGFICKAIRQRGERSSTHF